MLCLFSVCVYGNGRLDLHLQKSIFEDEGTNKLMQVNASCLSQTIKILTFIPTLLLFYKFYTFIHVHVYPVQNLYLFILLK